MKIEIILMTIVFAMAGIVQQKMNVALSIDDLYKDGQHIAMAKVENKSDKILSGTFVFEMNKTGSNTSSTRQSGDFVLKSAEEKLLSRTSINLNPGDSVHCKLVVKIAGKSFETEKILRKD